MSMTYTIHDVPSVAFKLEASNEPQFKLHRFDMATSTIDEVVAALKYNGGVIVKNFLTPEQVAETKELVTPILKRTGYKKASDPTKRVARLPTLTPKLVETILTNETYLGVTDAILSVHHRSWLGQKLFETVETPITMASTMFAVGPGAKAQDLHRDDSIYFNKHLAIKPEEYEVGRDMCISFFLAGVDVTAANGATRFIPGSHLERYDDQPDPSRSVSAEMKAGDCFFMLSSCYHGAGENSTVDQERLVYSLFAMQPHLRQEENLYLATPLDVVKQYPLGVQKRLGYDVAVPNLGWVDHASPLETILGHAGADKRDIPGYNPPVAI